MQGTWDSITLEFALHLETNEDRWGEFRKVLTGKDRIRLAIRKFTMASVWRMKF